MNMDQFSTLFAAVSGVTVIYLFHSLFYTSHILFKKQTVFDSKRPLPSSLYLMTRYICESLRKKRGQMRKDRDTNDELVFTLINCRYDAVSLRRFCSVVGYGWDYPDSVFRDIPLCYPELLFSRLLTMIVCSDRFKLCPLGLLGICETLRVPEAVDELKRASFSLQARVLEYRVVDAGVEVDVSLTASRDQLTIWSSTLTLLSPKSTYRPDVQPDTEVIHGVEAVRAPLTVSIHYVWPLSLLGQVTIRISENTNTTETTSTTTTAFSMEDHRTRTLYVSGQITRQSNKRR
ncbi:uncharacterized protein si:ch211-12e13.1 isoform X1 [Myxocyprinus asiaticus]|uniref:uncharacterized protein si:ch211-12e13.1 isoform X1 n=1 Tax=Myxocyprinus asiaticus TaxID=70543 RepID=UPI002222DD30|nr:uncharacterized protein si:ch211-12e13.1 isoform X1 [Myxocyprinus asiaticus]